MTEPREIELKLEYDPVDRDRLEKATLLAGADMATERLVASYFDTPRHLVRNAGYSLRIRREGRKRVQTVKADGGGAAGLFARGEWECEVSADTPVLDDQSGPLARIISQDAAANLDTLFVTDVGRATRALDLDGTRFACAVDVGEIRAGKRCLPINEVELELESGCVQAMFDFARRLDEAVPIRIAVLSKAERGYALAGGMVDQPIKSEPILLDSSQDAGEAFQAIAGSCVRQFRRNEDLLLRTGAAEALHQARVGLRRLRTAFSLFEALIAEDARVELLRAELRWLAAELGKVRNLDVLIAAAEHGVREQLVIARARTFDHVRDELASARTRLLMIDLVEWLAVGDWRSQPADSAQLRRAVGPFAANLLDRQWHQLKRRGKGLADLSDARRHKARIATKKLRYAAQFFVSLYSQGSARRHHEQFLDRLEALQDQLGALNDLIVGRQILKSLGIDVTLLAAAERGSLLHHSEKAYDRFIDAKRFWR
jgi:triphosphatase